MKLFMIRTPYHLILSSMISGWDQSDVIILGNNYIDIEGFVAQSSPYLSKPSTILRETGNIFDPKQNLLREILKTKNNIKTYKKMISSKQYTEIFIFNDISIEEQIVCLFAKKYGIEVTLIEDGSAAYFDSLFNKQIKIKSLFISLLFGKNVKYRVNWGTNEYVDRILLLHPELASKRLNIKKIYKLNPILKELKICEKDNIGVLIMVGNSYFLDEHQKNIFYNLYNSIIDSLSQCGIHLFIKYHPHEKKGDYLKVSSLKNCTLIDKSIPCELIIMKSHNIKILISDFSSIMLTANSFSHHNILLISIIKMIPNLGYENMKEVFQYLGVNMPTSLNDLSNEICKLM